MANFDNLKKLEVNPKKSVPYVFYGIEGEPRLFVKSSTGYNKQYLSAVLKRSGKRTLKKMQRDGVTPDTILENRSEDRELFALHVVEGWDEASMAAVGGGEPVPFSKENCLDFLSALPDDIFDDLRVFCGKAGNFRDGAELDDDDLDNLMGNSVAGSSGN